MKLTCIHCGKHFAITAQQLGQTGSCPHCQGEVTLPRAADAAPDGSPSASTPARIEWLHNSVSGLASVIIHLVLILVLALISYDGQSGEGVGEEVLIGTLPSPQLDASQNEQLEAVDPDPETSDPLDQLLEVEPPTSATTETSFETDLAALTPTAGGSMSGGFDLGSVSGGGSMAGGSWDGMLQSLRRNGLDIVITFDSTGSMSGEIRQVKDQIQRIGDSLLQLVPKARISICTYRDQGDSYVVKGLPLTGDIRQIEYYLSGIQAGEGGDEPEAVHDGLQWSIQNNAFRPRARKVILVFGDAPPHRQYHRLCLQLASDFYGQQDGVVSTVTCRSSERLPEFIEIAEVGGGEAFLTTDERQIMTQLMVLVFGSQHRGKVLEAFKLLER